MGSHTGCRYDHAETVVSRGGYEIVDLLRGAVGGIDVDFEGNAEGGQNVRRLLDDGQIAVRSHDDSDFFHVSLLI